MTALASRRTAKNGLYNKYSGESVSFAKPLFHSFDAAGACLIVDREDPVIAPIHGLATVLRLVSTKSNRVAGGG